MLEMDEEFNKVKDVHSTTVILSILLYNSDE